MSIFREYDIRGVFNEDLNEECVFKIGYLLGQEIKKYDNKVAIGYDARTHSPKLFMWLSNGLIAGGIKVFDIGMIPTPVAYFCTFMTDIKSSIMITGSHNPPQYNGFKITINQSPFYGEQIQMLKNKFSSTQFIKTGEQNIQKLNILESYISYITKEFYILKSWDKKVIFDCGNGVASIALTQIIKNLDLNAILLFPEPDGTFPNHHPDPSEEKNLYDLKKALKHHNSYIGIAYDGDADRVALISQNHNFKGDELAMLFARGIATQKDNVVVIGEVKCSQIMYDEINKVGSSVMYKTGHSNLKVKLKELNADLACEMSGHIFFNDRYFGYDDAIYASFRILELIYKDSIKQDNLNPIAPLENYIYSLPKSYSTDEEKIETTESKKFQIVDNLKNMLNDIWSNQKKHEGHNDFPKIVDIIDIDGVRVIFDNGWGLVRASNTTPMLVTRFESYSKDMLLNYKSCLLKLIEKCNP